MTQGSSREQWEHAREQNTSKVRDAVEVLEERVDDQNFEFIWREVKETGALFKLRPLDRDEQDQLRDRLNIVCGKLEAIQNQNIEEVEDALRELRNNYPLSLLDEMCIDVNRVMGFDRLFGADSGRGDMSHVWAALKEVSQMLHSKTLMPPGERRRLREDLKAFGDRLGEVQSLHQQRYNDDCNDNFHEINSALDNLENAVGERGFNDHRRSITQMLKTKRPLRREASDQLWERLNTISRCDVEAQLERLSQRRDSQDSFLDKQKEQKNKLEGMLYEARSGSDHEDRVRGWLQEVEDKIEEVKESIEKLDDRISSLRNRL